MSEATSNAVRSNARVVGVLLQCLSVVTLVGTFIIVIDVAQEGQQLLGVTATHDPVPWIVLVAGVIVSLVFAGLGYALAMLCALYDRQVNAERSLGALGSLTSKPQPSTEWRATPAREAAPRNAPASAVSTTIQKTSATSAVTPVTPEVSQPGLWKALTKERHFRKTRD